MIIYHNLPAMNAARQLQDTGLYLQKSMEKLASGMRINRAGDDAAGLAVSERMRAQIRGLQQAGRNVQDSISFIQTAEGALNETNAILHRMRELAIQGAQGTYSVVDRTMMQVEVSQLLQEINRIAETTEFNRATILRGDLAQARGGIVFHVGANPDQRITGWIGTMTAGALFRGEKITVSIPEGANAAIGRIDIATDTVAKQRADLGGWQVRLEHTARNLGVAAENMQAAESRIRDTDMAAQMVEYTRRLILMRSGLAMLAQANVQPQAVFAILG